MAQPTPYTPAYDFSDFQAINPDEPLPGDRLDIELNNIKTTFDGILGGLALIQRDDGALRNGIVTLDSLAQDVRNLMAGYNFRGAWATTTTYAVGDVVGKDSATYLCVVAHTSGVFATDFSNGKWTIIAALAASSAESYNVTGGSAPANGIYLPTANTLGLSAQGLDVMRLVGVASAVNYYTVTNSATGNPLLFAATGTDTNIGITITPKGTGVLSTTTLTVTGSTIPANGLYLSAANTPAIAARSLIALAVTNPASAVNWLQISGSATLFYPTLEAKGTDADIGLVYLAKGANGHVFNSNGGGTAATQLVINHTASSVNWWAFTGAATGNAISLIPQGSDTNIGITLKTKGTGGYSFYTNTTALQFDILHTASAVNNFRVTGAAASGKPLLSVVGSDTNIGLELKVKGIATIAMGAYTMAQFESLTSTADIVQIGPITAADSISIINKTMLKISPPGTTTNGSIIGTYGIQVANIAIGDNGSAVNTYALYAAGLTATGTTSVINTYGIYLAGTSLVNGAQGLNGGGGIYLTMPTIDATSSWGNTCNAITIYGPTITAGGTMSGSRGLYIGNIGPSGVTNSDALFIEEQTGGTSIRAIQYYQSSSGRNFVVDKDAWMTHSGFLFASQASQVNVANSTTFATVGSLSVSVIASGRYAFRVVAPVTCGAAGGIKFAIGGTCTVTDITYTGWNYNGTTLNAVTTTTTKGNAVAAATAVATHVIIEGWVRVNAAGTLLVQMAQNVSDGTNSSVLIGATFTLDRLF